MRTKFGTVASKRPRGRPAKGLRPGEKVGNYERLAVRLPPATKARVMALAAVTNTPAWLLIVQAVDALWDHTPADTRQLASRLAKVNEAHYQADDRG